MDPFRTVDLEEYLRIAPFVEVCATWEALFIQQAVPRCFFAYPAAVWFPPHRIHHPHHVSDNIS